MWLRRERNRWSTNRRPNTQQARRHEGLWRKACCLDGRCNAPPLAKIQEGRESSRWRRSLFVGSFSSTGAVVVRALCSVLPIVSPPRLIDCEFALRRSPRGPFRGDHERRRLFRSLLVPLGAPPPCPTGDRRSPSPTPRRCFAPSFPSKAVLNLDAGCGFDAMGTRRYQTHALETKPIATIWLRSRSAVLRGGHDPDECFSSNQNSICRWALDAGFFDL